MENNKPQVRFKGFEEDWKKLEISDVAELNPKHDIPETFNYVDLESVVGTEMNSYRKEFRDSAPSRAQRLAKKGDIFYQTVRPYQKNNYLFDINEKNFVFSTGYAQLRPKNDSYFLFSLVQSYNFVKIVLDNCTGTSYPAISSTDLAKIKQYFPEPEEQKKIGILIQNLDKLITEHQQKHSKLKALKKAMLAKMFPQQGQTVPEIRFRGFTGDWENKLFNELCWFQEGPGLRHWQFTSEGIKVINVTNLENGTLNLDKTARYISLDEFNKIYKHFEIDENDIVVASSGNSYGKVAVVRKQDLPLLMNTSVIRFKPLKALNYDYLHTFLKSYLFKDQIDLLITGGVQPNFGPVHLNKIHIKIPPTIDEQIKVGAYFKSLDELIQNNQLQVSKLQNIKKAFLAKMFI